MLKMLLLIEPVKVLKMLLIKRSKDADANQRVVVVNIEDEDYMMLKSFQ